MKKEKAPSLFQSGVEESLVKELMSGKSLPEVMAPLIKRIIEAGLEGELKHHLQTEPESDQGVNRRNGLARSNCGASRG